MFYITNLFCHLMWYRQNTVIFHSTYTTESLLPQSSHLHPGKQSEKTSMHSSQDAYHPLQWLSRGCVSQHGLGKGVFDQGGVCPGGICPGVCVSHHSLGRGVCPRMHWAGVSTQGVSARHPL